MASQDDDVFISPRSANVIPVDVGHRPPLRGLSGEQGRGLANEYAVLRVTLRAAENAPRNAGKFSGLKKVGDPIMSVQLMKSQHGDSDDPVSLLDGAEEVGPELCTSVIRRRRSVRWDEDFGLRWSRDPALYSRYFVLVVLRDASGKGAPRELGHQVVRFANLPITVEDAGISTFQGHWLLRKHRGHDVSQQAAGSVELDFTFEPPEAHQAGVTAAAPAPAAGPVGALHGSIASSVVIESTANLGNANAAQEERQANAPSDPVIEAAVASRDGARPDVSVTSRCPLPPGWVMCRTKKGRPFFVDHASKTTTFEDPRLSEVYSSFYARRIREQNQPRFSTVVSNTAHEEDVPLPPNWDERFDVDGRKFYVDHAKKRTTWVHPITGKKTDKGAPPAAGAAASNKLPPDFNRKLKKFRNALKEMRGTGPSASKQNILISRGDVLNTSLSTVMQLSPKELQKTPYVTFFGERGLDYGGLQREWFYLLSHEIFNPAYGLFEYSSGDSYILQANPNSGLANPGHLTYFRFSGRVLGMAVLHGGQIDAFFIKPVYKFLLGLPITIEDMQSVDPEYYKNMQYVLENDPTPLNLTFSIDEEGIGVTKSIDLVLDGSQMDVTMENRDDYVQLVCERRFIERCRPQMDSLRQGFSEVVPRWLLSSFNANELEVLIGGTAEINVQDWRKNTVYSGGYTSYSPTVQWFWEAVLSYTPEQRARLLQFATASSRVPMNGFSELQGSNGPQRFNLRQWGSIKDLPRAHTCFNRIDLPAYNSFKLTKEKLLLAIENTEGFDGVD